MSNSPFFDNENIKKYINKSSYSGPKQRGFDLYKSGAIKAIDISDDFRKIVATVQGTRLYGVKVSISGKSNFKTHCSCPYDYGGICKHTIAVLYHFYNLFKLHNISEDKINSLKKRNSSTPFEITEYKNLSNRWINENTSPNNINFSPDSIFEIEISENFASFEVYKWNYKHTVNFKFKKKKLFTSCDCNMVVNGFCQHQNALLKAILYKFGTDFFSNIKAENITKIKNKTAEIYGLPADKDYSNLFKITTKNDEFIAKPTGDAIGLVPTTSEFAKKTDIINTITDSYNIISISKPNELFELGFVFVFIENSNYSHIELIPITGKLSKNKSKLVNPIKTLDDHSSGTVQLSSSDNELINISESTKESAINSLLERYNLSYSRDFIEKNKLIAKHYETIWPKVKKIIHSKQNIYATITPYFTSTNLLPIKVSNKTVKPFFRLIEDDLFYSLQLFVKLGDKEISVADENLDFYPPLILKYFDTLYFIENVQDNFVISENFGENSTIRTTKNHFQEFFNNFIKPISKKYEIEIILDSISTETFSSEKIKKQLYISELGKFILFKPFVLYENSLQMNVLEHGGMIEYKDNKINKISRNNEFEKEYYDLLKTLHPKFENQFNDNFLHLDFNDFIANQWFLKAFEILKKAEIEVFGLKDLKNFKYSTHKANVSINISSGQDWFDVNINLSFGDENISLKDIKKAIIKQEKYVKLSDGTLGILPEEWVQKLKKYFRQGQIKKDELKISKLKFSIIDELFDEKDYGEIMQEILAKKQRLIYFLEIKNVRKPQKLKGTLRDYQKAGYNWLNFLDEFNWGGILADDMGLGKTVQILAFLLKKSSKSKKTNLIVLPTTLLFNWENEIEKFSPTLKYLIHYGNTREKNTKNFNNYDLIITTYGIMARDIELLQKHKFNYIILDESQAIKNPNSQRFKAASILKANNRLALTGTPIENNTFDLYAQMEFLNPGFLGSQKQFKENYSDAIDKDQNPVIAAELQNLINPFILRRTKEQVATELPPKTEDFIFCEMETPQRKVYDAFKNKYRNLLLDKIEDDGLGKSKIYVLEGLMKLRQICDTPEILSDEENYGKESIKIKEIIRHIKEKTGKHKILIFSQFVKMLSVIKRELDVAKINYEYLDGKSSKKARQASVEHFQEDDKCRVFIISLKAGGTGLNLTAADYVYIVDPWWNPAVENQAIDRCYRIGQDKKVIAYRMICKNTIEEKIMKYQAKKQKIASDIISTDDSFIKQLDKSDIEDLFT